MAESGITRPELIALIVKTTILGLVSYFGLKWTIDAIDPTRKKKKEAQDKVIRATSHRALLSAMPRAIHVASGCDLVCRRCGCCNALASRTRICS